MTSKKYLALLRGINVGGNNIIKMSELKFCFEAMGFTDVTTYIQSGNVVFAGLPENEATLEYRIEQVLSKKFQYKSCVVVVPYDVLEQIVHKAPRDFGKDPTGYRYDVIFFKKPLIAKEALKVVETKPGVDSASINNHALYFARLTSRATQSRLNKIVLKPEYKFMTIRNWNTTTKLLALMKKGQEENQ